MQSIQTDAICLPIPDIYLAEVRFDNARETGTFIVEHMELSEDDLVYVTGPMQDKVGTVIDVIYHCKIRPSKYERVVAKIDTDLYGKFIPLEHLWVTFDRPCMDKDKMRLWFLSPLADGECVDTNGFTPFPLHDLDSFPISYIRAQRGESYYEEHRVVYICLDKSKGYAIVQGSEYYEVTFTYIDGKIHDIVCNCYCEGYCKHEYAVLLQLQDLIGHWMLDYDSNYRESEYMAAIDKTVAWNMSVSRRQKEIIRLTEDSYEGFIIYED
ncbi:SWIM zinc finger domain-containing protein [Veillonella sp. VA142]|uniref:SWIM zinc finger family protein n=1 Tax=Veillonella sp. VA142 TaxID=741834 RepID=UPI000F8EA947|nr:hypothetical protein [Veillonella sp. VA142]